MMNVRMAKRAKQQQRKQQQKNQFVQLEAKSQQRQKQTVDTFRKQRKEQELAVAKMRAEFEAKRVWDQKQAAIAAKEAERKERYMKQMHTKNVVRHRKEKREQHSKQIARDVYTEAKRQQQSALQAMDLESQQLRNEAKAKRDEANNTLRLELESKTRTLQEEKKDALKLLKKEEQKLKRVKMPGLTIIIQRKRQQIERTYNQDMQLLKRDIRKRRSVIDFEYRAAIRDLTLMRQQQRAAINKQHADLVKKAPKLGRAVKRGKMTLDQASQEMLG
jgi:hypothetical protein